MKKTRLLFLGLSILSLVPVGAAQAKARVSFGIGMCAPAPYYAPGPYCGPYYAPVWGVPAPQPMWVSDYSVPRRPFAYAPYRVSTKAHYHPHHSILKKKKHRSRHEHGPRVRPHARIGLGFGGGHHRPWGGFGISIG